MYANMYTHKMIINPFKKNSYCSFSLSAIFLRAKETVAKARGVCLIRLFSSIWPQRPCLFCTQLQYRVTFVIRCLRSSFRKVIVWCVFQFGGVMKTSRSQLLKIVLVPSKKAIIDGTGQVTSGKTIPHLAEFSFKVHWLWMKLGNSCK